MTVKLFSNVINLKTSANHTSIIIKINQNASHDDILFTERERNTLVVCNLPNNDIHYISEM